MANMGIWKTTSLPGVLLLRPHKREDTRGIFLKCYQAGDFQNLGLEHAWRESYYTVSRHNVIRGMHFQLPPDDYGKLVTVLSGRVLDMALDLRTGSPAFGKHLAVELSETEPVLIYLPRGVAHGFGTLSPAATLLYYVTSEHCPEHDTGIRWDSFGADWRIAQPVLSERDRALPLWKDYKSPFIFHPPKDKLCES